MQGLAFTFYLLLWVGSLIFVIYVVMTLLRLLERAVRALETMARRRDSDYAEENRMHR